MVLFAMRTLMSLLAALPTCWNRQTTAPIRGSPLQKQVGTTTSPPPMDNKMCPNVPRHNGRP